VLAEALQRAPGVFVRWSADSHRRVLEALGLARLGWSDEEFVGADYAALIAPEDQAMVVSEVERALASGEPSLSLEYRLRTRDGSLRWVAERSTLVRDAGGQVIELVGVLVDVSRTMRSHHPARAHRTTLSAQLVAIPVPVFIKGADGLYQRCNEAFAQMRGIPREQLLGTSVYGVAPSNLATTYRGKDQELIDHPGRQTYASKVRFFDGKLHDVVFHKATYLDEEGRVAGIIGVVDDVTHRLETTRLLEQARETLERRVEERTRELREANKRLEESEQHYRELANSLPQTVFELDLDGRITWTNRNAPLVFRFPPEEDPIGLSVLDMVADADRERVAAGLRRAFQGEEHRNIEYVARRRDGTTIPVLVSTRAIVREGRIAGARGLVVDISERVELDRLKTEFLSIASHELRTPLTPLSLLLQKAQRQTAKGASVPGELLDRMGRHVRRLRELVDDLLEVTRIERGTLVMHLSRFDLRETVRALGDDYRDQHPTLALQLELQEKPITVEADRGRIEQVLANLLENALRYAPGSPVTIRVEAREGLGRVSGSDQGPGIPGGQQAGLFTRFYRATAPSRSQPGLGLGLFICREIVTRHSGDIGVISQAGAGATFWFTIPRAE